MNFQDLVDEALEELKKFSDGWKQKLKGDRFKNFRLIQQITGIDPEDQFRLFLAKEVSQIFTNDDEIDDSLFDLAMWAILWRAYRRMKKHEES